MGLSLFGPDGRIPRWDHFNRSDRLLELRNLLHLLLVHLTEPVYLFPLVPISLAGKLGHLELFFDLTMLFFEPVMFIAGFIAFTA